MKKRNLVSVVIPVYQSEATIERCVSSLVNGTYKHLQVILVEDCSQDSSWEKCKFLEQKYPQVQSIRNEKNQGVSYTRNQGLKVAEGKYLMFVDSDDWVEPDFVEIMVETYEKFPGTIPVCGYVNHDEVKNGRADIFCWNNQVEIKDFFIRDVIVELYEKRLLQIIWNKCFVTELVKKNNLRFEEGLNVGEDFRFLLQYIEKSGFQKFVFMNRPLYHYSRDNGMSLATTFTEISVEEPMQNLRKMHELTGKKEEELNAVMEGEYGKLLNYYVYAIMHDTRISSAEKKKRVMELSGINGKMLYRKHKILCLKESMRKGRQ